MRRSISIVFYFWIQTSTYLRDMSPSREYATIPSHHACSSSLWKRLDEQLQLQLQFLQFLPSKFNQLPTFGATSSYSIAKNMCNFVTWNSINLLIRFCFLRWEFSDYFAQTKLSIYVINFFFIGIEKTLGVKSLFYFQQFLRKKRKWKAICHW
jgi:hypothetical protein